MKKYFYLLMILLFAAPLPVGATASPAKNIVLQFVNDDIAIRPVIYSNAKSFRHYFTPDLRKVFDESIKQEQISIKATPQDKKPCIPDAEIFFSNIEGVSTVKILDVTGNSSEKYVSVQLTYLLTENTGENDFPLNQWEARIVVKKEKAKWLIDDIYDAKSTRSFKQILTDGLKSDCYAIQSK